MRGHRVSGDVAVSGVVHVIRDEAELERFREGEILVATEIPESWSHLFALAKAIITGTDDLPDHVTNASREFDIPLTNGIADVTSDLRSGDLVMMHIDGSVERLQDRRAPDSEMRVSVPAAVRARELAGVMRDSGERQPSVIILPLARHAQQGELSEQSQDGTIIPGQRVK